MLLNCLLVLYTIISSPPYYEKKASKGEAFYEAIKMPISWIKELYNQFINKQFINNEDNIKKSKVEKFLIRSIVYTIGLILFIGPILNMGISGYYILHKDSILQQNTTLEKENEKIKEVFRAYGKVYNSNSIVSNDYDRKVGKLENFIFEYQIESKSACELCTGIMGQNNFKLTNEFKKDKVKVLLFKKDEYISEIYFGEDKEATIILKRYNFFRESKLYDILSPVILITAPLNPLRRFEKWNFSW
jgi:hypothetical protein